MGKSSAQSSANKSSGSTRSNASLMHRGQATFGPHACVQRDATHALVHPEAPSLVRETLAAPGRPLDAETKSDMEETFGQNFSQVRVHTDERAAASARAVGAGAYATGSDLAFAPGRYAPDTDTGRRTLVHELSHVVQQSEGPVAGTDIGGGFSVSDPSDRFERQARETSNGEGLAQQASDSGLRKTTSPTDPSGPLSIQRAGPNPLDDQSGQGAFTARNTAASEKSADAAQTSANVGIFSAITGAASALVGAYTAIRGANIAERAAQAAEDPPSAEPTTGGIAVTDADIPEIKGLDLKKEDLDPDVTETEETDTELPKDKKGVKTTKKTGTSKVNKSVDKPDRSDTWHILNVNQGKGDSVDFYASIRSQGKDIKDGGTLPPESRGYLGGSAHANATVSFKARAGAHDANGAASVALGIGGTNTPPRKVPQAGGIFGNHGPVANTKYNVQRFGGSINFFAPGEKKPTDKQDPTPATPVVDARLLKAANAKGQGDGKGDALVTISLPSTYLPPGKKTEDPEQPL